MVNGSSFLAAVDHKRPANFTFEGSDHHFVLEKHTAKKFKELGSQQGATLYMNILTALNTLFYKYTGQRDIVIGTAVAGRPHIHLQHIVGMFVNTLALRNFPHGEKTYAAFLEEVTASSVSAFENQDVQFEVLVDKLDLPRDPSRNPLFDISMLVQNFWQTSNDLLTGKDEKNLPDIEHKHNTTKFDMTFSIYEKEENIHFDIEYYTGIFKEETIKRMVSHFKNVIQAVVLEPTIKLKDIDLISVTNGPGLLGSLLVGISFAKSLSLSLGIPLLGVNHVYSHIYANFLNGNKIRLPVISLVVSGGHTSLFLVKDFDKIEHLGQTLDDACGEAFDKVAKILGLGYPGGPLIEKLARSGNPKNPGRRHLLLSLRAYRYGGYPCLQSPNRESGQHHQNPAAGEPAIQYYRFPQRQRYRGGDSALPQRATPTRGPGVY